MNEWRYIAGPCAVESRDGYLRIARAVAAAGATMLRGGAFKPRTSPHSFQGLGRAGLEILAEAREVTGLPVVTEVIETRDVELVQGYVDVLQIGARNMQNFQLLKEVGMSRSPVVLKRGMSATLSELLHAAEYIVHGGNTQLAVCERGIRTFETATRNTLDLSAVPWLKSRSDFPVLVDPSHGTGVRELVAPMCAAALAAGADGLMIEVHDDPVSALSDGAQSILPDEFERIVCHGAQAGKSEEG